MSTIRFLLVLLVAVVIDAALTSASRSRWLKQRAARVFPDGEQDPTMRATRALGTTWKMRLPRTLALFWWPCLILFKDLDDRIVLPIAAGSVLAASVALALAWREASSGCGEGKLPDSTKEGASH